jgi:hypothetical protein
VKAYFTNPRRGYYLPHIPDTQRRMYQITTYYRISYMKTIVTLATLWEASVTPFLLGKELLLAFLIKKKRRKEENLKEIKQLINWGVLQRITRISWRWENSH